MGAYGESKDSLDNLGSLVSSKIVTKSLSNNFKNSDGWIDNSFSGSSSFEDTGSFLQGTQSIRLTGNINGNQAAILISNQNLDMTGKYFVMICKINEPDYLLNLQIQISSDLFVNWSFFDVAFDKSIFKDKNQYIVVPLTWGMIQNVGSGVLRNSITQIQVKAVSNGTGEIIANVDSILIVDEILTEGFVSLCFDDGHESTKLKALPIMNGKDMQSSYRGTIYTEENLTGTSPYLSLQDLKDFVNIHRWEIGGHGINSLENLTDVELNLEFLRVKNWLATNGLLSKISTYAYPNGYFNNKIKEIISKYFHGARSIVEHKCEIVPSFSPYTLRIRNVTNADTTGSIIVDIQNAKATNCWLILVFHGIVDNNPSLTDTLTSDFQIIVDGIRTELIKVKPVNEVLQMGV